MKLSELKVILRAHPKAEVRFTLPDGDPIPAHFHITEVGHVAKRFIDCGGKFHDTSETCLLQTHVGTDTDHRLAAGRLAEILELGAKVLPHDDLDVEVEYDCCVVAQYPIASVDLVDARLELRLVPRHTACLAAARPAVATSCC